MRIRKLVAAVLAVMLVAAIGVAVAVACNVTCPADDFCCYFTGNTKTVNGRLFYEYKCPSGHKVWVRQ